MSKQLGGSKGERDREEKGCFPIEILHEYDKKNVGDGRGGRGGGGGGRGGGGGVGVGFYSLLKGSHQTVRYAHASSLLYFEKEKVLPIDKYTLPRVKIYIYFFPP